MRIGLSYLSLSRRIVASVAVGLGFILLLFGLVVGWTIRESTEAEYSERVALAQTLAANVDPARPGFNVLPGSMIGNGVEVQLVDGNGRLLAGDRDHDGDLAEHERLLAPFMKSETAGYRIHEPSGDRATHVVAYAPVPESPSWGIIVEEPRDAVVAAPRMLEERLGLFAIAALLVAMAITWLDVRRVVLPLNQLTATAERFASGRLDDPITLERSDELGVLARALETMRQRLRTSLTEIAEWNKELEGRVAARTVEVERRNAELARLNEVAGTLYKSLQARERERAELLQRVMDAQEQERRRLAQELHDETSQALASVRLGLERLANGIDDPESARLFASRLQEVAAQTLADVHRLAVELRPSVLDDVGLVPAIDRYLKEERARGWTASVDLVPVGVEQLRLIPPAETAIYRIVQAALTNVIQHAHAQRVSVLVERRGENLVVIVEDDGRGYDLAAVRSGPLEARLGHAGMEERASLIGANLTIETAPGAGTTVFLEVPLRPNWRREETDVETADRAG